MCCSMRKSKAAKHPYKGGSTPLETNCGHGRCPANSRLIRKLHYYQNRDDYLQRAKEQPKDKTREYKRRWKENNIGRVNADTAFRKKRIKNATPKWLTEEQHEQIVAVYEESARLTQETGVTHHVDHIVPVRGKVVSGLHVPWNLQILTADENYIKNNKFNEPTT